MVETGDESGAGPLLKNRYQLGRVLGRGGMCIVYQAWDTRLERFVAIKRLEPPLNEDPRTRARFDREGRALALLDHPNIVALVDRGSSENDDYLVFEFVDGRSLKELIREGHISIEAFGLIVGQVAEGLASAHDAGIIHRDVKPQNILIDRRGHAKVSDFGIATGPDWTRVTRAGAVIGSARYMSPEQIRSKPVDPRSDVYSLGIVMYEMLTGHPPFDGNNMPEIARLHLQAAPPPMTDARTKMPPGLEAVVMRCLEKDPDDRFDSMEALLGALIGLGLYQFKEEVEQTASHKWSLRRGPAEERKPRDSSAEHPEPSGTRAARGRTSSERTPAPRADEEVGDRRWVREQSREAARRRRAKRKRLLVLVAGTASLITVITLIATCGPDKAPSVFQLPLEEARAKAKGAGLTLEVVEEIPSFLAPNTVLSQSPAPGLQSADGKLQVSVSKEPVSVAIKLLDDYDPQGDDRVENHAQVINLTDGNATTTWSTSGYKSPTFAGIPGKTGVGLTFSLAEGATMVKITSTVTGWKGELQLVTPEGSVTKMADLGIQQVVNWREPITSGRIWFTQLGPLPGGTKYGVVISEIAFYK
jgi:serine/threonine protein kinase